MQGRRSLSNPLTATNFPNGKSLTFQTGKASPRISPDGSPLRQRQPRSNLLISCQRIARFALRFPLPPPLPRGKPVYATPVDFGKLPRHLLMIIIIFKSEGKQIPKPNPTGWGNRRLEPTYLCAGWFVPSCPEAPETAPGFGHT